MDRSILLIGRYFDNVNNVERFINLLQFAPYVKDILDISITICSIFFSFAHHSLHLFSRKNIDSNFLEKKWKKYHWYVYISVTIRSIFFICSPFTPSFSFAHHSLHLFFIFYHHSLHLFFIFYHHLLHLFFKEWNWKKMFWKFF